MDESQVLSHLSGLFPNKSQSYLRRQYQKCNYNLQTTIEKIQERNRRKEGNIFNNFFSSVINGFKALFCNCNDLSSTDTTNILAESTGESEAQVANDLIREDEAFAKRLQEEEEQSAQAQVANDLIREDEAFAKRLQEEEERSAQASAVVRRVEGIWVKQSALPPANFPRVKEWPEVHKPRAGSAVKQSGTSVLKSVPQDAEDSDDYDEVDLADSTFEQPAIFYREQAKRHAKKRTQFYNQAKQCLRTNDKQRAHYYFNQAKRETTFIKENNNRAVAAYLAENSNGRKDTIDLHNLFVKEAIEVLDEFLDDEILDLEDQNCHKKDVNVITGRGKHSPDGIPRVKPAVINRLRKRKLG